MCNLTQIISWQIWQHPTHTQTHMHAKQIHTDLFLLLSVLTADSHKLFLYRFIVHRRSHEVHINSVKQSKKTWKFLTCDAGVWRDDRGCRTSDTETAAQAPCILLPSDMPAGEVRQTAPDCASYPLHKHAHTSRQVKPGKQCWIVQITLCTNTHTHQGKWSLANSVGLCKLLSAQTCTHIKASEAWQTVLDCASYSLHKHAHIYTVLDCACGYLYALMKKINFSFPDMEDIRKENCLIILNVYGHAVQNHCMHPLHTVTHWINLA